MPKPFIQKAEKENYLLIDGRFIIHGYVASPSEKSCGQCAEGVIYHQAHDAYFCAHCNAWLEKTCSDPSCEYCANRPEKPLAMEK